MKTEYRLEKGSWISGPCYRLKFKDSNGSWRFVPKEEQAKVLGNYLEQNDCSKNIDLFGLNENHFIWSFIDQQEYDLIPFTKNYPDIEKYFEHLREIRQKFLQKEQNISSSPNIIDL